MERLVRQADEHQRNMYGEMASSADWTATCMICVSPLTVSSRANWSGVVTLAMMLGMKPPITTIPAIVASSVTRAVLAVPFVLGDVTSGSRLK
jgi:hypothetical protein